MSRMRPDEVTYQGQVGLTTTTQVMITSDVGVAFPAQLYSVINVATSPELRDALLTGDINKVECPFTAGRVYEPAQAIVYHHPELRLFALLVPDALRHEEFRIRGELLAKLADDNEMLPSYVRQFETVFSFEEIRQLETSRREGAPIEGRSAEVDERRRQLDVERSQLDEVAERINRERARMDEVEERLAREREELETQRNEIALERQALEATKLNLEQQELQLKQGLPASSQGQDEKTQVVTDDQFIEIISAGDDVVAGEIVEEAPAPKEPSSPALPLPPGMNNDDFVAEERTAMVTLVPERFDVKTAVGRDQYVTVQSGTVLAAFRMDKAEASALLDGEPQFFVQFHEIQGIPTVALLLASLDDSQQASVFAGALLNLGESEHRKALDILAKSTEVRFAFYERNNKFIRTYDVSSPIKENVVYIRDEILTRYEALGQIKTFTFRKALDEFLSRDFERLGTMRHNFHEGSFASIQHASEAKLAAGIVGYWSSRDTFDYLVANRSFPLSVFRTIQDRVVSAAVPMGIYLNSELRHVAVESGRADGSQHLIEVLLANFAEFNVGVGGTERNDLNPLDIWENWDALLNLAEEQGITPNSAEIEMAELALRRAQEFQQAEDLVDEDAAQRAAIDVTELVVAKVSEATGVTYFLPDADIIGVFDNMATMPRNDLEALLVDANGRLEAAQMLISRFGNETVERVLQATEEMTGGEVAALARFFESNADGMEGELVQVLKHGGPSSTYVATRALVAIRSRTAIPALLGALRDDKRQINRNALAQSIADYGGDLLPELRRTIKRDGHDGPLVTLLTELEQRRSGTLDELAKDRNKRVQKAASAARELV